MTAKESFLLLCKYLGLFHLARRLTSDGLRILCYHGFAFRDEASFRPKLFMTDERFRSRLALLTRHHFPVLTLSEGLRRLAEGNLPLGATVITVDDGFYSLSAIAAEALRTHAFPATAYVSTYYVQHPAPIFRLTVQYLFWRAPRRTIAFTGYDWIANQTLDLGDVEASGRVMWSIIDYGERRVSEAGRGAIASELAHRLDVEPDLEWIQRSRALSLMTPTELGVLAAAGVDVQLHTHRHRLAPDSEAAVRDEIERNRGVLESAVGHPCDHLCYPSGIWAAGQWPWLERLGVDSATTCLPGFNYAQTPKLGLRRFLDAETISTIVFEAELFGFLELLRRARGWLRSAPVDESSLQGET